MGKCSNWLTVSRQDFFKPHELSDSREGGDDRRCGIMSKPDGLVTAQTLFSKGCQHVHLSLWGTSHFSSREKLLLHLHKQS